MGGLVCAAGLLYNEGRRKIAMSVQEIEANVSQLSLLEVRELKEWINAYHSRLWDKQIEQDLDSGRLDALLAEVDAEYEAGLAKPL